MRIPRKEFGVMNVFPSPVGVDLDDIFFPAVEDRSGCSCIQLAAVAAYVRIFNQ